MQIKFRLPVVFMAVIFGTITLTANSGYAQPESANQPGMITHGNTAIQFQLGSAFSQRGNPNFTIAGKHYFNPRTALQLGLGIQASFSSSNSNHDYHSQTDSSLQNNFSDFDQNRQTASLTLHYVKYYPVIPKLNFYWGAGPVARFSRSNDDGIAKNAWEDEASSQVMKYSYWSAGVSGILGSEWFLTQHISITGDYGVSLEYARIRQESVSIGPDLTDYRDSLSKTKLLSLNTLGVAVGITVYF